ncbi:hypothetical protein DBV15_00118 [Temnothorax longispinosus]|uniref:Uncharacterized protein n=1 Tax=Temnothorax longispinosus TaxID=300112 RepID=A0A4S2KI08_9HYME|nr:hypothetical protein DBV15_00118 [Temnothorax longispinosus]
MLCRGISGRFRYAWVRKQDGRRRRNRDEILAKKLLGHTSVSPEVCTLSRTRRLYIRLGTSCFTARNAYSSGNGENFMKSEKRSRKIEDAMLMFDKQTNRHRDAAQRGLDSGEPGIYSMVYTAQSIQTGWYLNVHSELHFEDTVSYTHLDVYKRQHHISLLVRALTNDFGSSGSALDWIYGAEKMFKYSILNQFRTRIQNIEFTPSYSHRFKCLNGCKELLSGSIINAIIKGDFRSNECQTDAKFARHSIFGSSPEPPCLENARRLDRDERARIPDSDARMHLAEFSNLHEAKRQRRAT